MRELSLFTGAGGGILGTKLLGWTPVGYVEWDNYCQRVLRQRQEDGLIERAPIFGDIRTFISEGYARRYRGMVDVITAGFPCQPFSVAGKQAGENDPRNMWPSTIECIRVVRPQYAFLENVPGLLNSGYFGRVLGDLAESGYDARWRVLSAAEVGAPHLRDRLWIVAHAKCSRLQGSFNKPSCYATPTGTWLSKLERLLSEERGVAIPTGKSGGVSDGISNRVDRLKAIGNGQVPYCVATAWTLLHGAD